MNWTKLSAIAEILSSVAILATLAFLMIGLQQNTDALQTSARQTALQSDIEYLRAGMDDPSLWQIPFKEELTDEEAIRLSSYLFGFASMRHHDWQQHRAGLLDEASWAMYQGGLAWQFSMPRTRRWWEYQVGNDLVFWEPGFVELVNSLLENQPILTTNPDIEAFR